MFRQRDTSTNSLCSSLRGDMLKIFLKKRRSPSVRSQAYPPRMRCETRNHAWRAKAQKAYCSSPRIFTLAELFIFSRRKSRESAFPWLRLETASNLEFDGGLIGSGPRLSWM